jgi:DNA-binding MarR family transcriptional regulator
MGNDHPEISEDSRNVLDAIRRIVQVLRKTAQTAEKKVGLSAAQLFVVRKLAETQMLSVGELAQRTATSQSSVSEVVQRLVTSGLVSRQRSARDARSVELTLTETGRELAARSPAAVQDSVLEGLNRMNPNDRKQLSRLLGILMDEVGIAHISPTMLFEEEKSPETADK